MRLGLLIFLRQMVGDEAFASFDFDDAFAVATAAVEGESVGGFIAVCLKFPLPDAGAAVIFINQDAILVVV